MSGLVDVLGAFFAPLAGPRVGSDFQVSPMGVEKAPEAVAGQATDPVLGARSTTAQPATETRCLPNLGVVAPGSATRARAVHCCSGPGSLRDEKPRVQASCRRECGIRLLVHDTHDPEARIPNLGMAVPSEPQLSRDHRQFRAGNTAPPQREQTSSAGLTALSFRVVRASPARSHCLDLGSLR